MRPALSPRRMIVSLLVIAAAMIAPATASAAPTVDGEFTAPGITIGTNNEIAPGTDGNMWVTLEAGGDVAKITPDGTVTPYPTAAINNALGITAGPDGNMWVTQNAEVVRFSATDPIGTAVAFPVGAISQASAITVGPDNNLWTTSGINVIRITTAGTFVAFPHVVAGKGITSGTDGKLWVADFGQPGKVFRINTDGTVDSSYPVTGGPQSIAAGPNGQVAYSDAFANPQEVGRLTAGGTAQITPSPASDPFGVTFGTDGAYWFADFLSGDLARLTTDGVRTTLGGFSAGSGPRRIAAGPNNTLWVTLDAADKIARVTGVDPPAVDPGDAPKVTIDKQPGKRVEAKSDKAKVKLKFSSPTAGAKFECSLVKKAKGKGGPKRVKGEFRACTSPAKYKLKPGKYTFSVQASANDLTGQPVSARFKVVPKPEE